MKNKYHYYSVATVGNSFIVETKMQKKAIKDFINSFPGVELELKKEFYSSRKEEGLYFSAEILFESYELLKIFRFGDALRAFCAFWHIPLDEQALTEIE